MRLLLSVAAALLLLLLAATASAQAANCTDAFPSPPTNLRARAGDGAIQLAWGPPANGACITGYQLTLVTVADGGAQGAAPVLLRVPAEQLNYTVTGLGNGQRYRVFVSGVSNKFKAGAEVQVRPRGLPCTDVLHAGYAHQPARHPPAPTPAPPALPGGGHARRRLQPCRHALRPHPAGRQRQRGGADRLLAGAQGGLRL